MKYRTFAFNEKCNRFIILTSGDGIQLGSFFGDNSVSSVGIAVTLGRDEGLSEGDVCGVPEGWSEGLPDEYEEGFSDGGASGKLDRTNEGRALGFEFGTFVGCKN